jgi:hypothetical protein
MQANTSNPTTFSTIKVMVIVVFIISTLIILGIAAKFALATKSFLDNAVEVSGRTISIESYQGRCGSKNNKYPCTLYRSQIEFSTPGGEVLQEKVEGSFENEKDLALLYSKGANPSLRFRNESFWLFPIVLCIVAFIEVVVCLPIILYLLKKKRT